ncbi:hypothetical protein AAEO56_05405 [Flavobacterium sp. DGU11]|uniref:Uncharacterized protein n=1 Tax=Flavobacterium arundinis TaxID=3139143 RepID=A0ABU9HUA7_9FLAO
MKKFLLPIGIIALSMFFACSSENDATSSQTINTTAAYRIGSMDVSTAKQLYLDMTKTNEYIDFKKAIKDFNSLLGANEVSFESKAKLMAWINSNLSKTSFKSVTQFETMFDDSVNKGQILIDANTKLFGYLGKADKDEIAIIVAPEIGDGSIPDYTASPSSCLDDCIAAYETAYEQATEDYYGDLDTPSGDIFSAISLVLNLSDYEHTIYVDLPYQFNNCVGSTPGCS